VSDDKLLQSRVFAYSDAQRYRLGANYQLLPVNAPKCPYKNNHYEGTMNVTQRDEEVRQPCLVLLSVCPHMCVVLWLNFGLLLLQITFLPYHLA